jgi:hypothetical protein
MTKYIPAAEVGKLARKDLKAAFPGQKFSVRTTRGNLDVEWIDGPATKAVEAIVAKYAGETFDGMTDMRSSADNGTTEDGEQIHYLTSFVFTQRNLSAETEAALRAELAADISKHQGVPLDEVLRDNRFWDCPQVVARETDRWIEASLYSFVRLLAEHRATAAGQA